MLERPPISPSDFFSNAAARAAGFTDQFWFEAYHQWLEALRNDPSLPFAAFEDPYTLRLTYQHGDVDVLLRIQPEGHEHYAIRLTAFPAEDTPTPRPIDRWYQYGETREVLGEAALLDANFPW